MFLPYEYGFLYQYVDSCTRMVILRAWVLTYIYSIFFSFPYFLISWQPSDHFYNCDIEDRDISEVVAAYGNKTFNKINNTIPPHPHFPLPESAFLAFLSETPQWSTGLFLWVLVVFGEKKKQKYAKSRFWKSWALAKPWTFISDCTFYVLHI